MNFITSTTVVSQLTLGEGYVSIRLLLLDMFMKTTQIPIWHSNFATEKAELFLGI